MGDRISHRTTFLSRLILHSNLFDYLEPNTPWVGPLFRTFIHFLKELAMPSSFSDFVKFVLLLCYSEHTRFDHQYLSSFLHTEPFDRLSI